MKIKINVKTPKGQAAKSVETQKKSILGRALSYKLLEQKVVSDSEFYWILEIEEDRYLEVSNKCFKAEIMIKKFYKILMGTIERVNKLVLKFKKGAKWVRKQIVKRLKKLSGENNKDNPLFAQIETMPDEEFNTFIKMNDKAAMKKLLAGPLITIEEIMEDETVS